MVVRYVWLVHSQDHIYTKLECIHGILTPRTSSYVARSILPVFLCMWVLVALLTVTTTCNFQRVPGGAIKPIIGSSWNNSVKNSLDLYLVQKCPNLITHTDTKALLYPCCRHARVGLLFAVLTVSAMFYKLPGCISLLWRPQNRLCYLCRVLYDCMFSCGSCENGEERLIPGKTFCWRFNWMTRTSSEWMWRNITIYDHALLRIHIGGQRSVRIGPPPPVVQQLWNSSPLSQLKHFPIGVIWMCKATCTSLVRVKVLPAVGDSRLTL